MVFVSGMAGFGLPFVVGCFVVVADEIEETMDDDLDAMGATVASLDVGAIILLDVLDIAAIVEGLVIFDVVWGGILVASLSGFSPLLIAIDLDN